MHIHLFHNHRLWLPWLLLGVILACNLPAPQTPAPMVTSMPAWSSPYPTYTPYPTIAAVFDEASASPTSCQPSITATTDVNVRKGPSKAYDIMGALAAGEHASVLGKSESQFGEWWYIQYPTESDGHGWVWGASTNATCILSELQVVAAPSVSNVNAAQPTKKPPVVITDTPVFLVANGISLAKSDIEVTKVNADSSGGVSVDIRNKGPAEFNGQVRVVCIAMGYMRGNPQNQIPFATDENIHINISIGTGFFPTSLKLNTAVYSYPSIQCTVEVPDDPNPNNNVGAASLP